MKKLSSFVLAAVLAALLFGGGLTKLTQASANNKKWHTHRIGIEHMEDLSSVGTKAPTVTGRIVRYDSHINSIVPTDAKLEQLADGFLWVEGPLWNRNENYLLFSDVKANKIYKWKPGKGVSTYLSPSGYTGSAPFNGIEPGSNGLIFDSQGRLVMCQHGNRRIARLENRENNTQIALADQYDNKRLNSPNDLVYKSNGDLYFTDPPYGLPTQRHDDPEKELPFSGVYRLSPDGKLTLLTDEIRSPNGIAFSPDEKILYISDSTTKQSRWLAYDVAPDGTLQNGRTIADGWIWERNRQGNPDGIKVDKAGNVYAAAPEAVFIFAPDGTLLGSIETGVRTSNVAWGEDGHSLFITANTAIYRIRLTATGEGY
ncbi:MAG: SMP-30/gluconolactonase/LRE family protein [Iphinoe sp. HA4291-MV1]|jgi:gluconolactonase|nr:SMP-30/gluconolactonase/LRE family protein [Iphinoe sp. HA4291-MV1]